MRREYYLDITEEGHFEQTPEYYSKNFKYFFHKLSNSPEWLNKLWQPSWFAIGDGSIPVWAF